VNDLYPEIEPYAIRRIPVPGGHELHVEECGHAEGLPAVFLHGGPGAGCEPYHRRFFHPERYRVVLFDQRGCGRSTPHASLEHNTTDRLLEDIELIRDRLRIGRWLVFGGSWGSTLAIAYAERYPERVLALVLRGIFLCRDEEIRWFYQEGASRVFPDYWEEFANLIPAAERGDLLRAYYRRLTGTDEVARMAAAKAWSRWEARTASLLPSTALLNHFEEPRTALALARLEAHYFFHQAFLDPNQLLRAAERLRPLPGVIVQGRYDVICPMQSAWELHRAWPQSKLHVISDAGHAASEPGIRSALVRATDHFAESAGR